LRVWSVNTQESCVHHFHKADEDLGVVQVLTLLRRDGVPGVDDAQRARRWDLVLQTKQQFHWLMFRFNSAVTLVKAKQQFD
jgi:hypothetical protein